MPPSSPTNIAFNFQEKIRIAKIKFVSNIPSDLVVNAINDSGNNVVVTITGSEVTFTGNEIIKKISITYNKKPDPKFNKILFYKLVNTILSDPIALLIDIKSTSGIILRWNSGDPSKTNIPIKLTGASWNNTVDTISIPSGMISWSSNKLEGDSVISFWGYIKTTGTDSKTSINIFSHGSSEYSDKNITIKDGVKSYKSGATPSAGLTAYFEFTDKGINGEVHSGDIWTSGVLVDGVIKYQNSSNQFNKWIKFIIFYSLNRPQIQLFNDSGIRLVDRTIPYQYNLLEIRLNQGIYSSGNTLWIKDIEVSRISQTVHTKNNMVPDYINIP